MTDAKTTEPGGVVPKGEKNTPSHIPHSVRRGSDGRSYWTEVGVAFAHKAKTGVNVSLNCLPMDGALVIRERRRGPAAETAVASETPAPAVAEETSAERSTAPTHLAWHVRRGSDEKSYWTSIGTAFAHADGKGWNVRLDLLPRDGIIVVLERTKREPQPGEPKESVPA